MVFRKHGNKYLGSAKMDNVLAKRLSAVQLELQVRVSGVLAFLFTDICQVSGDRGLACRNASSYTGKYNTQPAHECTAELDSNPRADVGAVES